MSGSSYVVLGRIIRAHGIRGEMDACSYAGDLRAFTEFHRLFLATSSGRRLSCKIRKVRPKKKQVVILSLEGVEDRNQAEALAGSEICVSRKDLPSLIDGEYYWHDLIGMKVRTLEREELGRLTAIMSTGAHDVLVVKGPRGEILIPMVEEMIEDVDISSGIITVDPVPGLLDMNAL